jgi:hypothetical protein
MWQTFHLTALIILSWDHKLWSSSFSNFLHSPVTSSFLGLNILSSALFLSNTLNLQSSFRVRGQVSLWTVLAFAMQCSLHIFTAVTTQFLSQPVTFPTNVIPITIQRSQKQRTENSHTHTHTHTQKLLSRQQCSQTLTLNNSHFACACFCRKQVHVYSHRFPAQWTEIKC